MFFWIMIARALRRQAVKRLMIAVTVMLGASLTTSMLAVMFDVGDKVQEELSSYGSNLQVLPQGRAMAADLYNIDSSEQGGGALREDELPNMKTIFWTYNIENFTPYLETKLEVDGKEEQVRGTWFDKELAIPTGEKVMTGMDGMREWWKWEGTWGKTPKEVIVGSRIATKNDWKVDDTLQIRDKNGDVVDVVISGIFTGGDAEDSQIYADLDLVQQLTGRDNEVDRVEVRAITTPDNDLSRKAAEDPTLLTLDEWETWYCTAYVSSIAYQIEEVMTNAVAKPVRQVADTEGEILNKTELIMAFVALFAVIGSSLGIANLVFASVMERSREIGLMKAIGARNREIIRLMLTEVLIVGLFGGVVGFALGFGLAQLIGHIVFGSAIAMRPIVAPLMALIVFVTVLLGSLPAIRSLVRVQPAQVLHGR